MKIKNPAMKTPLTGALCLGFALTGAAGCSSEEDLGAYLEIEGDRNVYLDNGEQTDLRVRYQDGEEDPLAGTVYFDIQGEAEGAELQATSAQTDDAGYAEVRLDGAADEQASFTVEADAQDADPVEFGIQVEAPAAPLDAEGTYEIESSFDLVSGLEEGTVRDVVHTVLDFTDDPGTFLLNLAYELCVDTFSSCPISEEQVDALGPVLTTVLENEAPDLVGDLLDIGSDFNQLAHDFEVVSELEVNGGGESLSADHSLTGVVIVFDNERHPFTMGDMGVENLDAYSVSADLSEDESEMVVGEHALPMTYGSMLKIGINEVIVPAIDDTAEDLEDFLQNRINCESIASEIADRIDFIDESTAETGCELGITLGTEQLMNLVEGLDDTGLEVVIEGEAQPVDTNNDDYADALRDGRWEGELEYGGSVSAELDPSDNTFRGERIDD